MVFVASTLTHVSHVRILTALLTSRRIFFRIEVYILYRLACTLQILIFFFIGALSFVRYHTYLGLTLALAQRSSRSSLFCTRLATAG